MISIAKGYDHGINWYFLYQLVQIGNDRFIVEDTPYRVHKDDCADIMEGRVLMQRSWDGGTFEIKGYGYYQYHR